MKKRVLVVENNKEILEMITIVLQDAGYDVECYLNEKDIFEHIVNFKPDAILLDIVKPTLEGTELCRQLKAAEGTTHIPVIVLSTHPHIDKVKEVCADDTLNKPFDIDELLELLAAQIK